MEKNLYVWENSLGMMSIAWTERHTSLIYPDEPGNIKAMADCIGVSDYAVKIAIQTYRDEKAFKDK